MPITFTVGLGKLKNGDNTALLEPPSVIEDLPPSGELTKTHGTGSKPYFNTISSKSPEILAPNP